MKCRYSYCKHGGEVNKEDAIKARVDAEEFYYGKFAPQANK